MIHPELSQNLLRSQLCSFDPYMPGCLLEIGCLVYNTVENNFKIKQNYKYIFEGKFIVSFLSPFSPSNIFLKIAILSEEIFAAKGMKRVIKLMECQISYNRNLVAVKDGVKKDKQKA